MTAIIERFCAEYPLAKVLVTSRVVGYDEARLDDRQFVRYRLDGFDDERTASYVAKWFARDDGLVPGDGRSWAEAFMAESAQMPDLRSNPLMLALLCILYRARGRRRATAPRSTSTAPTCCSARGMPGGGSTLSSGPGTWSSWPCGTWPSGCSAAARAPLR